MARPDPRYWEVERWFRLFATSHAKRVSPRIEVFLETEGERIGRGYGLRLILGSLYQPPVGAPPMEVSFPEIPGKSPDVRVVRSTRARDQASGLAPRGAGDYLQIGLTPPAG